MIPIKRWQAISSGKSIVLYGDTPDEIREKWNCVDKDCDIVPYENDEYIEYVDKVKEKAEYITSFKKCDYEIRELYVIYLYGYKISLRLSKDLRDDKYYDFCEYQCSSGELMSPITWNTGSISHFCDSVPILSNIPKKEQGYVVTPKELKKIKPVKFYNSNSETYWRDSDGYFYTASKYDLPNKKNKAEWEQFHDSSDAVLVKAWWGYYNHNMRWYDNMDVFMEWRKNEAVKNTPSYCAVPKYEVVKRGYTKVKPDDRRVIFRLPYFPVDMDDRPAEFVARVWVNEVDKRWYGDESDMYEHLVSVIKQWRKWKEMDKSAYSQN